MKIKGDAKKIALAYIKDRYIIGSEIVDLVRSGSFIIRKNSIFEIYSDSDQVAVFDESNEEYSFLVRKPGKYSPLYHITHTPKRWVYAYYNKHINKK